MISLSLEYPYQIKKTGQNNWQFVDNHRIECEFCLSKQGELLLSMEQSSYGISIRGGWFQRMIEVKDAHQDKVLARLRNKSLWNQSQGVIDWLSGNSLQWTLHNSPNATFSILDDHGQAILHVNDNSIIRCQEINNNRFHLLAILSWYSLQLMGKVDDKGISSRTTLMML